MLVSPEFLYRAHPRTPQGARRRRQRSRSPISSSPRGSRSSCGTGPDEELLTLAAAGKLRDPDVLERTGERMLADPRASSLVTSFALKWLNSTSSIRSSPTRICFPRFDEQLRRDFSTEARAFVGSICSEDRSVVRTADRRLHVPERAARAPLRHSRRAGPQFRKVTLTDQQRFGLLGKAAVLLRTSYGDRTSPVLRGAWVLDKLMGTPPTPPPPERRHRPLAEGRRAAEDGARAARAASRQGRAATAVPRRDRSDRPGAGELRRDRPMARRGPRGQRADRCQHGAAERRRDQRPGGARGATVARPDAVRAGRDREAA